MIELQGECRTCCSGRSIDYLVVSTNLRHCIRNVLADKSAPWPAHVAIAFDVLQKPPQIRTWQLVSLSPLIPHTPSCSAEEAQAGGECRSQQTRRKKWPSPDRQPLRLSTPSSYPQLFSKWSVASEGHLKPQCQPEGFARCGRVVAT